MDSQVTASEVDSTAISRAPTKREGRLWNDRRQDRGGGSKGVCTLAGSDAAP